MCGPVALAAASAAPQMMSSVMGFIGQNQAAAANSKAANLSYANTSDQLGERESQIDTQQSENTVSAMIDRIAAQGRISASASSMGSDAATSGREANAADFGAGRSLGIEDINSANLRQGIGFDRDNAFYARQTQENQVLPQSPLQLALGLAKGFGIAGSTFSKLGGTFPGTGGGPTAYSDAGSAAQDASDGASMASMAAG